jgi:type II secretion system protein C
MNININVLFSKLSPYLIIILLAYSISSILYMYLPKTSNVKLFSQQEVIPYKKYKLQNSMKERSDKQAKEKIEKKEYKLLDNLDLQAVYAVSPKEGWITIAEKKSKETYILSVGEKFKEYTLFSIFPNYVIFKKNNNNYKLMINEENNKAEFSITHVIDKKEVEKEYSDVIQKDKSGFDVNRTIIDSYTKNISKIWKEVKIQEVKKGDMIDGFEIIDIDPKSPLIALGLKKNDIIKKVNNVELKSYKDAFSIYKKINTLKNLKFTILRNYQEMEIEYEIK